MAFVIADRVRETTTTTGTGTITLAGAVTNFETFAANLSNSDTTYYAIVDNTNSDFEVGVGTFTASGTTLARSVIASSNSNNLVDFGAGTKDVFITVPASKIVVEDGSNNVAIGGTVTATSFRGSGAGLTGVDVVNDSTPQLGGDLDAQNNDIENVGIVEAKADAGIYGSSSSPVEFTVTVASKTSGHPYPSGGSSSGNAYFINGIESPAITLHGVDSTTSNSEYHYRFTLSSSDMSSDPACKAPSVTVRLPVDAPVAVVVPTTNVSALSSHINMALSPVEPLSITIPQSLEFEVAPLFSSNKLSLMVVFVVSTVVVVPLTVKSPVTVRLSFTVVSDVVCPIDIAVPDTPVPIATDSPPFPVSTTK